MIATSTDFVFPPTDRSVPPALAIDFHLKYNPSHLWSVLYDINDSSQTGITYEQLAHAVHRVAHILNPGGKLAQGTRVGLLISAHTVQYVIVILGMMRAGLVPFPISPRTHVSGIAHLLGSTQTSLLVAGGSQSISDTTLQLTQSLAEINFHVQLIELPSLKSILPELNESGAKSEHKMFPALKPMANDTIVNILHSSGSTGMPRPVKYDLEGVLKNFVNQPFGWLYAGGTRFGLMALPTFHAMGVFLQVIMPLYAGYTQVMFAPSSTPIVPTPDMTIKAAVGAKCEYIMCVPAFLEAWSADENAISQLRRMNGIMFGVRIHCCYGATEVGHVHEIWDLGESSDWGYIKFSPHVDVRFIPQNDADNTFELMFVASDDHRPFVLNYESDGKLAYRTKDLVVRHPWKSDLWRILGRLDDQIVLLNGEKTNPGPMETEIVKCPIVRYAVMFGREQNQTGVLIELEESSSDLYRTKQSRVKALEEVWPFIERANQSSPTHSRLEKQAVIFTDPARPLPRTPKGTVSRSATLKLYARDVLDMYLELEEGSGTVASFNPLESWSGPEDVEAWIKAHVQNLLGRKIDVATDLFQQGMDSLTATMLLRTLKSNLRAATKINQQAIFAKPTVRQLAQLVVQLSKNSNATVDSTAEILQNIRAMIQKYDSGWSRQIACCLQPVQKEHVVVTGTTGGLGSYLLARLLENDKVERVWAMNRKSNKGNRNRQTASFEDKLLDIRSEATIIIHNAWQVNFNFSLQSFEPSIRGVRNLLDLAFESTARTGSPRFTFVSSIAAAGFICPGRHLSEVPVALEDAATGIGYGQSKLVAEKLLESARGARLQTCIVRLGQLTGDVASGSWSTTDWVPSLVGSSVSLGCLPGAVGTISWLPLDVAANSIIDICVARGVKLASVVHAAHPSPVAWMDIMTMLSSTIASRIGSEVPIIRFDDWNKRVTEAAGSFEGPENERLARFPSTKMQSTVDGMVQADNELRTREDASNAECGGTVRLDISRAEAISESLRLAPELGMEYVRKWVEYWECKGLFKCA
ncbi:unnamed protein product [Rhizoctonia solani]|uniref:Carrier domain-containing protein n=1 Tax=Rhizoctonia solani TaxID=456999 RepID=A0A8H2XZJ0_9AGAM|nr:unnamed protein product [Rhizoctonia solani]